MRRPIIVVSVCVAAVLIGLSWHARRFRAPVAKCPLPHAAYVWQRVWGGSVREAVRRAAPDLSGFVVLGAEVTWVADQFLVARVPLDYEALRSAGRPVGVAVRVGPYAGSFDDSSAALLSDLAKSLVARVQTERLALREVQLDFDCPESKLDGYRVWVQAVRSAIAPVPLRITVLLCWLDQPAFGPLAAATDGYVLQVHSLQRPKGADAPVTLCDPLTARRAVTKAGRLGVPFEVALPTYGYVVAFDGEGRLVRLAAEEAPGPWPAVARLRDIRADPVELARLVRAWTSERPPSMKGIIWYRLPTDTDRLNWRWVTLRRIIRGEMPRFELRAEGRWADDGSLQIELVNDGEADMPLDREIVVSWPDARLLAAQGLNGFELADKVPTAVSFRAGQGLAIRHIPPGEHRVVGLVRLSARTPVVVRLASCPR